MKDNNALIILLAVAGVGYLLWKSGALSGGAGYSDKYTAYAGAAMGLANNATSNFLGVHNAISSGINDQINRSVDTVINSVTKWAQMAQENKNQNDNREHEQFMQILHTI